VPFGQRRGDFQPKRQFAGGGLALQNLELNEAALDGGNARRVFMSIAVKQVNGVAGAKSANRRQVMGFGAVEASQTQIERTVEVKSSRHPWYNTSARASRRVRMTDRPGRHREVRHH